MSAYMASNVYGVDPTNVQPTPTATPDHLGGPEPTMRTTPMRGPERPVMVLVGLVGLAVLLSQVSFRGTIAVKA